jgi:co-chaperonin GroES (HSP10)
MAVGETTYKNRYGYLVELNVKKGDRVLVPRKVRRITADITTEYFLVSMFDILSFWV